MTKKMTDSDRLYSYVRRFFLRSAKTEWPTVRQAARSLKWAQERVSDAVDGDGRFQRTSYDSGVNGDDTIELLDP